MIKEMTESLFSETIKRIAEDVWKVKMEELATAYCGSGKYYGSTDRLKDLMEYSFHDCLKKDDKLRMKLEQVIIKATHEYLDNILKGGKK